MSKYSGAEVLKNGESYYSLVIASAKRAREIAEKAELERVELTQKPVITAIQEIEDGEIKIIENQRIKGKME